MRLHERHYGALQGEDKTATVERAGDNPVWRWRRGYLDRPPVLADDYPRHPAHDLLWRDIDPARLPDGESLAQTRQPVVDYWQEEIMPQIRAGQRLLISSHGNTLRALLMALEDRRVNQVGTFGLPLDQCPRMN